MLLLITLTLVGLLIHQWVWPAVQRRIDEWWIAREVDYINGDRDRPAGFLSLPEYDLSHLYTEIPERPYLKPENPFPMRTPRGMVFDTGQLKASYREFA